MSLSPGVPAIIVACCLALSALSVSLVAGMAAENPTDVILTRGLLSMLGGLAAGFIVGKIGERVVRDRIALTPVRAGRPGPRGAPSHGGVRPNAMGTGISSPTTNTH